MVDPEEVPDLARPAPEYLSIVLEEQTLALLHALRRREPDATLAHRLRAIAAVE